jgi:hypothetical protein
MRRGRLASATIPLGSDLEVRFSGTGRVSVGEALVIDFERGGIYCGHCGGRHCGSDEDLLPALRQIAAPLAAAGAVRGQDYDLGRFALHQICCRHCGTLVDVQVAFEGASRCAFQIAWPRALSAISPGPD